MGAVNIVGTGAVLISSTSWRELAAPSKTLDARVAVDMAFVEPQVVDILPKENLRLARAIAVIIGIGFLVAFKGNRLVVGDLRLAIAFMIV